MPTWIHKLLDYFSAEGSTPESVIHTQLSERVESPSLSSNESIKNPLKNRQDTGVKIDRNNNTARFIADEIQKNGKIPFSEFMNISLFSPEGYYSSGKAEIGSGKDFETAPEVSPLFGATIGHSLAKVWDAMGKPETFRIIEMGAGHGAMADGLVKEVKISNPDFYKAIRYTILEYGDLIKKQHTKIEDGNKVEWVKGSASDLPFANVEGAFISNELPDAFPIEVVKKVNGDLVQKYIGLENDQWMEIWDSPSEDVSDHVAEFGLEIQEHVEEPINLNAARWQRQVDAALKRGVILTIDYGKPGQVGDKKATRVYGLETFVERNNLSTDLFADPKKYAYISPGNLDITADINFKILEKIAKDDGLNMAYSHDQELFLQISGLSHLATRIVDAMQKSKSWKEQGELCKQLNAAYQLLLPQGFGKFHALLLSKGIDFDVYASAASRPAKDPFLYRISLKLGKPHERISLKLTDFQDKSKEENYSFVLDENGFTEFRNLPIMNAELTNIDRFTSRFTFFGDDGREILDLSRRSQNKQKFKDIINNSGYDYDL